MQNFRSVLWCEILRFKWRRWVVAERTSHCRHMLLGATFDHISRKNISSQKSLEQKKPPRVSTRSTARGGLHLGMCRRLRLITKNYLRKRKGATFSTITIDGSSTATSSRTSSTAGAATAALAGVMLVITGVAFCRGSPTTTDDFAAYFDEPARLL